MDLVSILIPAFKPRHFRESLESAIAQTWENTEIIISDDSKTEEIHNICKSFKSNRVQYIKNPWPDGSGHNNFINLCMQARGNYFKFLFDDDILDPECIELLLNGLKEFKDSEPSFAFSKRKIIDTQNIVTSEASFYRYNNTTVINGKDIIKDMTINLTNPIGELTTILFHRSLVIDNHHRLTAPFINKDKWMGLADVGLYLQFCEYGPAIFVPKFLSSFRKHNNSNSNPSINPFWLEMLHDWERLVEYSIRQGIISDQEINQSYIWLDFNIRTWINLYPELREPLSNQLESIQKNIDLKSIDYETENFLRSKGVLNLYSPKSKNPLHTRIIKRIFNSWS